MARRYSNLAPEHLPNDFKDVLRWGVLDRLTGKRRRRPLGPPAPRVRAELSRIDTDDPVAELAKLNRDGQLLHLTVDGPDLESVFLHLTGRHLRD